MSPSVSTCVDLHVARAAAESDLDLIGGKFKIGRLVHVVFDFAKCGSTIALPNPIVT